MSKLKNHIVLTDRVGKRVSVPLNCLVHEGTSGIVTVVYMGYKVDVQETYEQVITTLYEKQQ